MHQHRFDLGADALLLSSGCFAAIASVGLTLMWLLGGFESGSTADQALSDTPLAVIVSLGMLAAGLLVGPIAAWRLHGHTLHWRHLLALVGGPALLGAVSTLLPLLASVFQPLLRSFTSAEYAGAMLAGALMVIPYLMLLWHATRDAMAPAGDPPMLERMRLLSLTSLGVLVLVVVGGLVLGVGGEIGEALAFAVLMGYSGASIVLVASGIDEVRARRAST